MALITEKFDNWQDFKKRLSSCSFNMGRGYSDSGEYWRKYNYSIRSNDCKDPYLFITGNGFVVPTGQMIFKDIRVVGLVYQKANKIGGDLEQHKREYEIFYGNFVARAIYAKDKYKKFVGSVKSVLTFEYYRNERDINRAVRQIQVDRQKHRAEMGLNSKETHDLLDDDHL